MKLKLSDTFNKELPADPNRNNSRRQVLNSCFSFVAPKIPVNSKLLHVSDEMLVDLGLKKKDKGTEKFKNVFSGAEVYPETSPYSMCYGGHQFGGWSGQLGDGRAINLCEIEHLGKRWALQLKGAGETPYSRTADGLAVLRSSIREHLCSESMFHLGVPTTRSLSLSLTGDQVLRDILYDGNAAHEKGAVVCRVSPSFIRFGNFQIFASRQDKKTLKKLVDYTIKYFFPHLENKSKEGYIQFFKEVAERTLEMVVHWQRVGFVHGVMNTDNMSILGLTIDYGPYGWLEGYDPGWTPNTTDAQGKRYQFGNQSLIALWNLLQLGNALYPMIEEVEPLQAVLNMYQTDYPKRYQQMMLEKLGLYENFPSDAEFIELLENNLQLAETDMTIFFRNLSKLSKDEKEIEQIFTLMLPAFYKEEELTNEIKTIWHSWIQRYLKRLNSEQKSISDEERRTKMNLVNPKYVLRNYMAQLAIDDADTGNYALIDELYQLLKKPYDEQPENKKWFAKRPEWARHKVGCSMLSCSS